MPATRPTLRSVPALRRAWSTLGEDPVRLLAVSGAVLCVDAAAGSLWLQRLWTGGPLAVWPLAALSLAWLAARAPLRAMMMHWAVQASGRPGRIAWHRVAGLVALDLLTVLAGVLLGGLAASPALALAAGLAAQGFLPGVVAAILLALALAYAGMLVVRTTMAPRQLAMLLREESGRPLTGPPVFVANVLFLSDAARLLGSMFLMAGALPTYALPWLALLEGQPTRPAGSESP